jgi:hypothetical protein
MPRARPIPWEGLEAGAAEVVLERGIEVSGRVLEAGGRPIAGATLTQEDPTSRVTLARVSTATDGRFTFRNGTIGKLLLHIEAPGCPAEYQTVWVVPGMSPIGVRLPRARPLRGTVTDESGKPISGALLLGAGPRGWRVRTDRAGRFAVDVAPRRTPVGVVAAGYHSSIRTLWLEPGDREYHLRLSRMTQEPPPATRHVAGIVRLPDGSPAAGADVTPLAVVPRAWMTRSGEIESGARAFFGTSPVDRRLLGAVRTDTAGRFETDVLANILGLAVTHESGFAMVPRDRAAADGWAISLSPWGLVSGELRTGGVPASGERVWLANTTGTARQSPLAVSLTTTTRPGGRFVFDRVPPGTYQLARLAPDERVMTARDVTVDGGRVTSVRIGGVGRPIVGRVVVVPPHAPVDWQARGHTLEPVAPLPGAPRLFAVQFSGDGRYRIEDVPAGSYRLSLRVPGFPAGAFTENVTVPAIPGGRSDAPLDLGTITLR